MAGLGEEQEIEREAPEGEDRGVGEPAGVKPFVVTAVPPPRQDVSAHEGEGGDAQDEEDPGPVGLACAQRSKSGQEDMLPPEASPKVRRRPREEQSEEDRWSLEATEAREGEVHGEKDEDECGDRGGNDAPERPPQGVDEGRGKNAAQDSRNARRVPVVSEDGLADGGEERRAVRVLARVVGGRRCGRAVVGDDSELVPLEQVLAGDGVRRGIAEATAGQRPTDLPKGGGCE